jgi:hypothetical protein
MYLQVFGIYCPVFVQSMQLLLERQRETLLRGCVPACAYRDETVEVDAGEVLRPQPQRTSTLRHSIGMMHDAL